MESFGLNVVEIEQGYSIPEHNETERDQEEVFVVISGALTMLLGDPPERIDVGPESVVAVEPGTPLQVRNESSEELVLYVYGAPPEQEGADFFDDPGDL